MLKGIKIAVFTLMIMLISTVSAFATYPQTMSNGNLVLVDAGMGVGRYADRTSVVVQKYAPPYYQITINVVPVQFSDEYWRQHKTYEGGPYTVMEAFPLSFRYNWNTKTISFQRTGDWNYWDINKVHSHADGDPLIPYTAEVAFVAAYNMRFFDNKMGYNPILNNYNRVISESLYSALGI
ncbi:MAG: hypothetical protein K6C05_05310 [Anaerovibrio sp.]|uniref:hypothetical protein n=1 Tax=Anaerovibrio sp. TaxID=1872532 RepID=UPI0025F4C2A4|nr:hypothetical protein [Anaerovibrio sp.]MCR5176250.1 hypothetical protein [Anaerovibrio sp.]